jgi:2-keto-3-deoxy-L-fuconate dehydrogenase
MTTAAPAVPLEFEGLAALVTGAGSGIGAATAALLQERGARVAGLDVAPEEMPAGVVALEADLASRDAVDAAVGAAAREFGRLDVLVNNAGIGAVGAVEDNDDEEWHRVYDINVVGMVRAIRAALPHLRRSHAAAIVNVASLYATTGLQRRACYSASKGAVMSLTLSMAADLAVDGIRVNCVCPGSPDTPWSRRMVEGRPDADAIRAKAESRIPSGRRGRPEDLAHAIAFCASPANRYLVGAVLPVDGGMSTLRVWRGSD